MKKVFLALIIVLTACAETLDGKKVENTKVVQLAIDEVKLISAGISNPNDPSTFFTSEYTIGQNSKLLMRLGVLKISTAKIVVEQPVLFRVSIKHDEGNMASQRLKLCPILTEWMMGATWTSPQRNHKTWNQVGGDFDISNCLLPIKKDDPLFDAQHPEEKEFCNGSDVVCYEIKTYINAYIRSRNVDYGFALINGEPTSIVVYGDRTVRGPEIFWRKLKW